MDLNVKYSKNISKLNLVMSQKNYTPQPSRTYSKYAKMTLRKNKSVQSIHQQTKEERPQQKYSIPMKDNDS